MFYIQHHNNWITFISDFKTFPVFWSCIVVTTFWGKKCRGGELVILHIVQSMFPKLWYYLSQLVNVYCRIKVFSDRSRLIYWRSSVDILIEIIKLNFKVIEHFFQKQCKIICKYKNKELMVWQSELCNFIINTIST